MPAARWPEASIDVDSRVQMPRRSLSDEFTVPLCRGHHRQLHQAGNEIVWWENLGINALEIAKGLWEESRARPKPIGEANVSRSDAGNLIVRASAASPSAKS